MSERTYRYVVLLAILAVIPACASKSAKKHAYSANQLNNIETAAGHPSNVTKLPARENIKTKQCSFSSFHRKNTIGYELDDRRHIGFRVSPDVNVFDLSDTNVKMGLRFTMALGGSANKRPKCTYGSGYYGLLPYAMNNEIDFDGLTDIDKIKSYAQERMDAREQRRIEREERASLGL